MADLPSAGAPAVAGTGPHTGFNSRRDTVLEVAVNITQTYRKVIDLTLVDVRQTKHFIVQ
jgi:hypothetical protein